MSVPLYYCREYAENHAIETEKLSNLFGLAITSPFYVFETSDGNLVPVTHIGEPSAQLQFRFPNHQFIGTAKNRTPLVTRSGVISARALEIAEEKKIAPDPDILREMAFKNFRKLHVVPPPPPKQVEESIEEPVKKSTEKLVLNEELVLTEELALMEEEQEPTRDQKMELRLALS
ncbi:MAG: hypothetical protein WBK55_01195 [Alphaproteobacteria bacterium]